MLFFEPKRIYRAIREEVPEDEYTLPIGKARTVCEGTDLTIVSWGASVVQCMQAIEKMSERDGCSIELIDLRTIYPFDMDAVAESVSKTGRCVVVHEAPLTCGFGSEIAARIMERCFCSLRRPCSVSPVSTPRCRTTSSSSTICPMRSAFLARSTTASLTKRARKSIFRNAYQRSARELGENKSMRGALSFARECKRPSVRRKGHGYD